MKGTQGEKDTILQESDVDNPEGTVYILGQQDFSY